MTNAFGMYKKYLNKYTTELSKREPREIQRELHRVKSMDIPQFEKILFEGTLAKKLPASKRKSLGFGNVAAPVTQAAMATAAAQTAAATAAQTAMATLAAPATMAVAPPTFVPAVAPPTAPQSVRITSAGVQPVTNYAQAAGAIATARSALMDAGRQLQMVAGAQNLSG